MLKVLMIFLIMSAIQIPSFSQYEEYDVYEEADEVEETVEPTHTTNVTSIPLFDNMKSYYAVDLQNPQLPAGHWLLKLRGSVWRSHHWIISTNCRGVASYQRLYIFFAPDRDSVAFKYAPYTAKAPEIAPIFSDYMALHPLLQTNIYRPQPYQYRYLSIESPYATRVQPLELSRSETSLQVVNTSPSEEIIEIEESVENYEEVYEYEFQDEYQQEYYEDLDDYQQHEETALHFSFFDQNFVAQQQADPEFIVVNIGGLKGGIFVHENKNSKEAPYTVILLTLGSDGSLWAYSTQIAFDIRVGDSDTVKGTRKLYEKALASKANLKRFIRVHTEDSDQTTRFFK